MARWIKTLVNWLLIWPIGALLIYLVLGFRLIIPVNWSSVLMGAIVRLIAPLTSWQTRARKNIQLVMPELSKEEQNQILQKMWWNLGRNIGEFPYLDRLSKSQFITEHGAECIDRLKDSGGFLVGGHLGNWELSNLPIKRRQFPFSIIYRPLNNPLAKHALNKRLMLANNIYVKGMESARGIVQTARNKGIMVLLVDQKLREGMIVPFFNKGATTPVSYIKAVLKNNLPLIMVRVKRRKGCKFDLYLKPIDTDSILAENPKKDPILAIATAINAQLEEWIRDAPEQWFWPHRRWPESKNESPYDISI